MRCAGFVLAGGKSTRMGRNKALLPFHGIPLGRWVARQVAEAAGGVTLLGDPELGEILSLPVLEDARPGDGPLGGLLTALRTRQAEWNLIVACDLPLMTSGILRALLEAAEEKEKLSIVPVHQNGDPEPLCAVYNSVITPIVETEYEAGRLSMRNLLRKIGFTPWPIKDLSPFANVNSPAEFVAAGGDFPPRGESIG